MQRQVITLTTDFGLNDPFVGIMKGVILGINPDVHVIDISHNINRHNILEASQTILISYKFFPKETIHVVVVDPGVGSGRRPILVTTGDYYFIGPDNGIFTPIYEDTKSFTVIHLTSKHYFLPMKGSTFHGKDIFAPAAAYLSKGIDIFKLGEEIADYVKIPSIKSTIEDNRTIRGNVITIDIFGNAITNIKKEDIEKLLANSSPHPSSLRGEGKGKEVFSRQLKILYKGKVVDMVDYYAEAETLGLSAIINSFGYLEIFAYKGSASESFNINIGDSVNVTLID